MSLPLEKQVCSLDLAKRLKELGVKQESEFYWWTYRTGTISEVRCKHQLENSENPIFSALTVAELGEMLPQHYSSHWHALQDGQATTTWVCEESVYDYSIRFSAWTEADARAKMLVDIIENKLIELPCPP
ncbi:MAG TPA: hypothetical protein VLC46_26735 [Thermoanaerobaculia bacterium]|jgi:hypothetical protein|nr:hypothetical protein [Thermoanaerobaculia bacterium]